MRCRGFSLTREQWSKRSLNKRKQQTERHSLCPVMTCLSQVRRGHWLRVSAAHACSMMQQSEHLMAHRSVMVTACGADTGRVAASYICAKVTYAQGHNRVVCKRNLQLSRHLGRMVAKRLLESSGSRIIEHTSHMPFHIVTLETVPKCA
jgi:hypothetical protein